MTKIKRKKLFQQIYNQNKIAKKMLKKYNLNRWLLYVIIIQNFYWENTMCDVVFITPNIFNDIRYESIGTLQLVTILRDSGINCEILQFFKIGDINNFDEFLNNAVEKIKEKQPKIISFYTRCDSYHVDLRLAECFKKAMPNVFIVFGGPQSDITSERTIEKIEWVDFVCCGEGENTIFPFFSSLINGESDLSIPGLVYRSGGLAHKNPRPALIEDLDTLPFIDYSLSQCIDTYLDKKFPIEVGRGCPFGCTFCSTNTFWGRKYGLKSPQRIVGEVKNVYEKFGRTYFNFTHDMFTFDKKKVIETCRLLNELNLPLEWSCSARLDCLDFDLINIMADAGLNNIYLGIETGSQRMQKLINKRLKLEKTTEIIQYLSDKGIKVMASFIYGFPEETEEDISQTIYLMAQIINIKNTKIQAHLCTFMAGTELTRIYKDELTPVDYYTDINGGFAVNECKDIIENYPELFEQMFEYKTELRTKMQFFDVFMYVWMQMKQVYQYISEKYNKDSLIQMYYDFVESNLEVLENTTDLEIVERVQQVICNDKFYKRFSADEKYDIISDIYRLKLITLSKKVQAGGTHIDAFCFDPECIKKYDSIKDYPRVKTAVVCTKNKVAKFALPFK